MTNDEEQAIDAEFDDIILHHKALD